MIVPKVFKERFLKDKLKVLGLFLYSMTTWKVKVSRQNTDLAIFLTMDACILTLLVLGGGESPPTPLVFITCCALKNADMNSKILDNLSYDPIEALVK